MNCKRISIQTHKPRYFIKMVNLPLYIYSNAIYKFLTTFSKIISIDLRQTMAIVEVATESDQLQALALNESALEDSPIAILHHSENFGTKFA